MPAHALLWHREDTTPYECDGLTAYRQRPLVVALPETLEQVQGVLRTCYRTGRAGGGARRGHRLVGRRHASQAGRDAVTGQVQQDSESGPGQPHGGGAVRRAQPGHQRGGSPAGSVLRARPVQPDRLHHWRQRGRKRRRRALPEVRPDAAQHPAHQGLHHGGRARGVRVSGAGRAGARPDERRDWLRGHAGHCHRGHGQTGAQAATGTLHHGQL